MNMWKPYLKGLGLLGLVLLVAAALSVTGTEPEPTVDIMDSGGPLMQEQASYNVSFYDLDLQVQPASQTIQGTLTAEAQIVQPIDWFVLDLDTLLAVEDVVLVQEEGGPRPLSYERNGGKLWIDLERTYQPGEPVAVRVAYGGAPRVAKNPPWVGGFTWAETTDGQPWIATSMQGEGADLWWPVKDHPSDEPDSMALHITVPEPLVVASNGHLRGVDEGDGQRTYHWFVSTPINNYGVALNIAPYRTIEDTYTSITGDEVPVTFWVLPERYEDGQALFPQFMEHLAFYEKYLGPYPFRADKYGVAHTPHLGMEHQTIIAYGSDFTDQGRGYDWLHHHELGHEWWGNLVTAFDWRDFWIHEGFCTYMQALYAEELFGKEGYQRELQTIRGQLRNAMPLAPRDTRTTDEIYFINVERGVSNHDIYYKGAWVLHTLRYVLGDDAFFEALRRMAYPSPAMEEITDGRQTRFVSTDDFLTIAEAAAEQDLDWFFEVYMRQPDLPRLVSERDGTTLHLRWEVPGGRSFPMPVDVQIAGDVRRVPMPKGSATVTLPDAETEVVIDPDHWLLMQES